MTHRIAVVGEVDANKNGSGQRYGDAVQEGGRFAGAVRALLTFPGAPEMLAYLTMMGRPRCSPRAVGPAN
jgi:hypothetical protein